MKRVKRQVIESIQFALEQCNFADVSHDDNPDTENDLPTIAATTTFKHFKEALISLGCEEMFNHWVETNEWKDLLFS